MVTTKDSAQRPETVRRPFGAIDLLLVLMSTIWGVNFTVVKTALQDFAPLSFNALRFVIASVVLFLIVRARRQDRIVRREDLGRLILLGIMGHMVYQVAFIQGLAHTRAGHAALIVAITPIFIALLSAARGHERLSPPAILGVILSFLGMIFVVGSSAGTLDFRDTLYGNLLLLSATVCWAVYTVSLKRFLLRYGALPTMMVVVVAGTVPLVLISIPSLWHQAWGAIRPLAWLGLLYSALGAIVVSFFIWNYAIKHIGGTRTAAYSNLTPVIALFVAWLVLNERPTPGQLAGTAIILLGIYLTQGKGASPDVQRGGEGPRL